MPQSEPAGPWRNHPVRLRLAVVRAQPGGQPRCAGMPSGRRSGDRRHAWRLRSCGTVGSVCGAERRRDHRPRARSAAPEQRSVASPAGRRGVTRSGDPRHWPTLPPVAGAARAGDAADPGWRGDRRRVDRRAYAGAHARPHRVLSSRRCEPSSPGTRWAASGEVGSASRSAPMLKTGKQRSVRCADWRTWSRRSSASGTGPSCATHQLCFKTWRDRCPPENLG